MFQKQKAFVVLTQHSVHGLDGIVWSPMIAFFTADKLTHLHIHCSVESLKVADTPLWHPLQDKYTSNHLNCGIKRFVM